MTTEVERYKGADLPDVLVSAGVNIIEQDGARVIVIPDELRQKANVLLPVQTVAQAVDLVRPSIRVVKLDATVDTKTKGGVHFYKQAGDRLAPTKQALETLAFTAGITLARSRPLSKHDLSSYEEGTIGFEATVGIRRPDGTVHEITATKVWQPTVEKRKIGRSTTSEDDREKRWLAEREFAPAKTESKATLRAIRAALQIPHTFSPSDAAKPFVVVGYDLALDYADPDVVRLLLERAPTREAEVYGGPELPTGGEARSGDVDESESQRVAPLPAAGDSPTGGGDDSSVSSPPPPFKGEEPGEPEADPEPNITALVLPAAFTRYAGRTVAEVAAEGDADYLRWIVNPDTAVEDERIVAAASKALEGFSAS